MKTKNIPLFSDELLDQILADDTLGGIGRRSRINSTPLRAP